jgi:hypothetical protein
MVRVVVGHVGVERIIMPMCGVEDALLDFIAAAIKDIRFITTSTMVQRILGLEPTIQMVLVNGTISHDQ